MTLSESELQELAARLDAELPTVHEAVNRVMRDVQAIEKGQQFDEYGVKYRFRGIDDVVNAVGPRLREHKVIIAPVYVDIVNSERYDTKRGTAMQNVIVKVSYTVRGPRGDEFPAEAMGQSADVGDKAVAKAQSVAYRVMLLGLLCIPTGEKDPDSENHEAVGTAASNGQAQPAPVNEWSAANAQIEEWRVALGWTVNAVFDHYAEWNGGQTLGESTVAQRQGFVQQLAAYHLQRQAPVPGSAERGTQTAEHDAMTETQTAAPASASDEPPF